MPDEDPVLDGLELDFSVLCENKFPKEDVDVGDSGVIVVPLFTRLVEEVLWLDTDWLEDADLDGTDD